MSDNEQESVTVRTQREVDDALAGDATRICIDSTDGARIHLSSSNYRPTAHVEAWDGAHVVARDTARVVAWGGAHVVARDSAHVEAWDGAHVVARDGAHIEAGGSARVVAWGGTHVMARDTARNVAWGGAHVEARGSAHVVARDGAHVVARGSAHVVARDGAHVEAWGGAHVEAWGSARVMAAKYTAVHLHSQHVQLDANGAVIDMTSIDISDPREWCAVRGVKTETIKTEIDAVEIAWVYKAVNNAWTTDRGTVYSPGSTPEAPDWEPTAKCGQGLHFCATPSHSAEYYTEATRYVRCGVSLDECVGVGDKLKARRVLIPCVEVDRYGMEVSSE